MKKLKSIFVNGIVKDSKNNMEKYLFNENERLNAIIDELEDINEEYLTNNFLLSVKINKAIEYIETHIIEDSEYENYMQMEREEKEELIAILRGDKEDE